MMLGLDSLNDIHRNVLTVGGPDFYNDWAIQGRDMDHPRPA